MGETFTGLRSQQFEWLLRVVRERDGNGAWWFGRGSLTGWLVEWWVLLVTVYLPTTLRLLAPLFGVSAATMCGVIPAVAAPAGH